MFSFGKNKKSDEDRMAKLRAEEEEYEKKRQQHKEQMKKNERGCRKRKIKKATRI